MKPVPDRLSVRNARPVGGDAVRDVFLVSVCVMNVYPFSSSTDTCELQVVIKKERGEWKIERSKEFCKDRDYICKITKCLFSKEGFLKYALTLSGECICPDGERDQCNRIREIDGHQFCVSKRPTLDKSGCNLKKVAAPLGKLVKEKLLERFDWLENFI